MTNLFEQLLAQAWNRLASPDERQVEGGVEIGQIVRDGVVTSRPLVWPHTRRPEHLAILGKTGTGKSSLLKHLATQDIRANHGFIYFDLHGDTTGFLLRLIAAEEIRRQVDLSTRVVVIEPGDPDYSIGLNVIERGASQAFVQIGEFANILKQRWGLEHFGPRTEELLRNALFVLSDNDLTLVELGPLLINGAFRAACLHRVQNPEVRDYFKSRYDRASEAMQAIVRDAVLNKLTAFTADPAFRHIIGQQHSTFSLLNAVENGYWIFLNLDKGRLGEQASTLGSLFLAKIKNALFARKRHTLFSVYADEIQNLVTFDSGISTLFSEARKFSISVVSANQFLDQYPPQIRSAVLSVASHILFQLSSADADRMAAAFGGGRALAEILKNLPKRHLVAKLGHHRWRQAIVPTVVDQRLNPADLYERVRRRWAWKRADIEAEIRRRQPSRQTTEEVLHDWE